MEFQHIVQAIDYAQKTDDIEPLEKYQSKRLKEAAERKISRLMEAAERKISRLMEAVERKTAHPRAVAKRKISRLMDAVERKASRPSWLSADRERQLTRKSSGKISPALSRWIWKPSHASTVPTPAI